jgi:hypothetical protein
MYQIFRVFHVFWAISNHGKPGKLEKSKSNREGNIYPVA